jgi:hypothetical protein
MGAQEEGGGYVSISRKRQEVAEDKAAERESAPPAPAREAATPAHTDPGPQPDVEMVDELWVEQQGRSVLPDADALANYLNQLAEGRFRALADQLVIDADLDLKAWVAQVSEATASVRATTAGLNTKQVSDLQSGAAAEFEPLPGVPADPTCTSTFDVNDLALRGRKAVYARRYAQPLVLFDASVWSGPAPSSWRFGQKLEYQQEWRHEGFTLGELTSSMSLLPGEELTIEVSSFQRTRSEIQSEEDVTTRRQLEVDQKNTDERACTNAVAANNGWSLSASASVSYPVASASLSASAYGNSSERAEQNTRHLSEVTTRAVDDISSRRAVKVTQTAESGSETTTTRRLRNPNPCQTVTFNFFQVIKLYDVQIRLLDDRPTLLLPGLFPLFYGPKPVREVQSAAITPTQVVIPVHLVEGWNSPAVFLTQYFEVDRELSQQISGWALRSRADFAEDPLTAARQLAEGLVVATKYLFKQEIDTQVMDHLTVVLRNYLLNIAATRTTAAARYGPGKGQSQQLNTGGLYLDALRGRCTACTDHEESGHYVEVMTGFEELRRLKSANALDAVEAARRQKRLEAGDLDPFGTAPDDTP